jgi:hypothetical protein
MTSEVVPVPLPWKRPYKGLMVAELGLASFRVERKEDGWTCGVQVDKERMQVLARGLVRQRDGQCRAEAYAASLPEEIKARQSPTAQPEGPSRSGDAGSVKTPAKHPRSGEETSGPVPMVPATPVSSDPGPVVVTPAIAFERVDDGCICGRMKNGTWVADPKGCVTLPRGASAGDAEQIRKFAADYFARPVATPASAVSTTPAAPQVKPAGDDRLAKARAVRAAKAAAKQAGHRASARDQGAAKKSDGSKPKHGAARGPVKTEAPVRSPVKKGVPSKPAAKSGKTGAAAAKKTSPSKGPTKTGDASKKPVKKDVASKGPTAKNDANKGPTKNESKDVGAVKKTVANKRPDAKKDAAGPAPAAGPTPLKWHDVDGQPRANTPFGAFSIEPEGDHQALYFYDLNGQSFFLGNRGDLRKIADERAARGGVMPSVSRRSGELDAQLRGMIINVGEDMR